MDITTPFGTKEDATTTDLEAELSGIQAVADPDVFVTVSRSDGSFLQIRQLPLERGDGVRQFRAHVPEPLRATFRAFAEGRPGWDQGIEWIDVTNEKRLTGWPGRAPRAAWLVVGALVLGSLAFAAWKILPHLMH